VKDSSVVPELKEIAGAMIFGFNRPLSIKEIVKCLKDVAATQGEETAAFGSVRESDIAGVVEDLKSSLETAQCGFKITEVGGGYKLQSDVRCGKWLKHLLESGRAGRLSRPALETLAIIAYRQPVARSEIEAVRGVAVDHVIKTLLEIQLVRIVCRSELPGRPFLYGTTQLFLEHFGLRDLNELKRMGPMLVASAMATGRKDVRAGGESEAGDVKSAQVVEAMDDRPAEVAEAPGVKPVELADEMPEDEYDDEDED
jgi:segregation and condensation protein B